MHIADKSSQQLEIQDKITLQPLSAQSQRTARWEAAALLQGRVCGCAGTS